MKFDFWVSNCVRFVALIVSYYFLFSISISSSIFIITLNRSDFADVASAGASFPWSINGSNFTPFQCLWGRSFPGVVFVSKVSARGQTAAEQHYQHHTTNETRILGVENDRSTPFDRDDFMCVDSRRLTTRSRSRTGSCGRSCDGTSIRHASRCICSGCRSART